MPQAGTTLNDDLMEKVNRMTSYEKRTFSQMLSILIAEAVAQRELNRPYWKKVIEATNGKESRTNR